jgi:hypothetical protein
VLFFGAEDETQVLAAHVLYYCVTPQPQESFKARTS